MAPTTKVFQCNECGHQVQRPLAPMTCPACGKQRVGLFKDVGVGKAPMPGAIQPQTPVQPQSPAQPTGQGGYAQPIATPNLGQPGPIMSPPVPGTPGIPQQPFTPTIQPQMPVQPVAPTPAPTPGPVSPTPVASTPTAQSPVAPAPPEPAPEPPPTKKKKTKSPHSKPKTAEAPPMPDRGPPQPPAAPPSPPTTRAPTPPPTPDPPPKVKRESTQRRERSAPASSTKTSAPDTAQDAQDTFAPAAASSDRVVWQYPEVPPSTAKRRPLRNCVAVSSTGAIIAAIGSKVVALEEKDGKAVAKWSYSTGNRIPGSPALGPDDSVRVHSADGMLHCLSADGEQAWAPSNVGKPLGWSSPVVDAQKCTWICGYSGGLMKLSADGTHMNRRFFRSREKFDSTGVLHNGVFYVGSDDGFVYAIKLEDRRGHNLWDQRAGRGLTEWFVNSSPAIGPGPTIVASSRDDCVYGFGLDGAETWKVRVDGQMLASPVIDPHGRILVSVSRTRRGEKGSGALIAISGNSHQVEWEYPTDAPCESTPVVGDDEVTYFGDNSGIIHAVDREGNRVWTAKLGSPVRSAGSIPSPNRVVFGLDNETLVALECSSKGLANLGWPKYMGNLSQSGVSDD